MTDFPSRHSLESDLIHHQQTGDFAAQAETLMTLAQIAHEDEAYSLAQGLYGQAWAVYESTGDERGIAAAQLAIGEMLTNISYHYQRFSLLPAEFSRVYIYQMCESALALYQKLDDKNGQADAYLALAEATTVYGNAEVQVYYQQALSCYEMLEDIRGQADMLYAMTHCYSHTESQRRVCYERAIRLYHRLNDERSEGLMYHQLGFNSEMRDEYDEARSFYETAQSIFSRIGEAYWLEETQTALAEFNKKD